MDLIEWVAGFVCNTRSTIRHLCDEVSAPVVIDNDVEKKYIFFNTYVKIWSCNSFDKICTAESV